MDTSCPGYIGSYLVVRHDGGSTVRNRSLGLPPRPRADEYDHIVKRFAGDSTGFLSYFMNEQEFYIDGLLYNSFYILSNMSEADKSVAARLLGIEQYREDPYLLLTLFNMVKFTGWKADKAREYLTLMQDSAGVDLYRGLLLYVLGVCDRYYESYKYNPDPITQTSKDTMYQWLRSQTISTIIAVYLTFVMHYPLTGGIASRQQFDFTPGHILHQIVESVDYDDVVFQHFARISSNQDLLLQTYTELGISYDPDKPDAAYNRLIRNYLLNSSYIRSKYASVTPRVTSENAKWRALVICYNHTDTDVNDSSVGVNIITKDLLAKIGMDPNETLFDAISHKFLRVDNQFIFTPEESDKFPSPKMLALLQTIGEVYDFVIFEACPTPVDSITYEIAETLHMIMKPGAILVNTKTYGVSDNSPTGANFLLPFFRKASYNDVVVYPGDVKYHADTMTYYIRT